MESCYGSVSTRLVFTSKRMLPVACKDFLPATQKSSVIYEYKRHCDTRYLGRTFQRLENLIKQHVPQWLKQKLISPRRSQPHRSRQQNDTKPDYGSAIAQHRLEIVNVMLRDQRRPAARDCKWLLPSTSFGKLIGRVIT